jgi:hypothetical protein
MPGTIRKSGIGILWEKKKMPRLKIDEAPKILGRGRRLYYVHGRRPAANTPFQSEYCNHTKKACDADAPFIQMSHLRMLAMVKDCGAGLINWG